MITCPSETRLISNFLKIKGMIYPQNLLNQTYGCWLITPNQKTLSIETNIFLSTGNYKSASGQLKNDFANGAMLITINRVINDVILKKNFLENKETLTSQGNKFHRKHTKIEHAFPKYISQRTVHYLKVLYLF